MKALIRNQEVWAIPSTMSETEMVWQSTKFPQGNSYALCTDCPEDSIASDFDISEKSEVVEDGEEKRTIVRLYAGFIKSRYDQRMSEEE